MLMRRRENDYRPLWLGAAVLLLTSGCAGWPGGWWSFRTASGPPPQTTSVPPPQPTSPTREGTPPVPEGGTAPLEPVAARGRPTALGSQLNLRPDETVVERALELTARLNLTEEEKKALAVRVQQLEQTLEQKEKALTQSTREVQAATEEVAKARADLQRWRQEVVALRDKLRGAEKENLATLQALASVLEKFLEQEKAGKEPPEEPEAGPPVRPVPRQK
jgi:hypothetical protein